MQHTREMHGRKADAERTSSYFRRRRAAFSMIHQLKRSYDIRGFRSAVVFLFHFRKEWCDAIVPAEFPGKLVPNMHLHTIQPCAARVAPFENLLVTSSAAH